MGYRLAGLPCSGQAHKVEVTCSTSGSRIVTPTHARFWS